MTTTPNSSVVNVTNGSLSDSNLSNEGHHQNIRTLNYENLSKTNLYIKGLLPSTNDDDLHEMCSKFGYISSTKAIIDKATGECRGYGFVEFTSPQSAERAVKELTKSGKQAQMAKISSTLSFHHYNTPHGHNNNHHHHHNHQQQPHHHHNHDNQHHNNHNPHNNHLYPNNHQNKPHHNHSNNNSHHNNGSNTASSNNSHIGAHHHHQNADPTNLYIANLPTNMDEQELENLLSAYGPVVSTRILRDQRNIPRGVGFARMETREKCEYIIEQLNGKPCRGWNEPLLVKFADGGNRKRYNQSHNHHHNHQHQSNNISNMGGTASSVSGLNSSVSGRGSSSGTNTSASASGNNSSNSLDNSINNGAHSHPHHKAHADDSRWRESTNKIQLVNVSNFERQNNISHSNHLPDLAMMGALGYARLPPGYPPAMPGAAYPAPLGPPTSAPQWIHAGAPGQPYVLPQQIIPAGMSPPNPAAANAAAAAALHYGQIPQLASQMQNLQIAHPGAPSVGGYIQPQHQWSALWAHHLSQQTAQPQMRLPTPMQAPSMMPPPQAQPQQQQPPPPPPPQSSPPNQQQQQQPTPQTQPSSKSANPVQPRAQNSPQPQQKQQQQQPKAQVSSIGVAGRPENKHQVPMP